MELQTPEDMFKTKDDFMAACYLAAMQGYLSKWSIPGSRLDRDGWAGVASFLEHPAPWQELKEVVIQQGAQHVTNQYVKWSRQYEIARKDALSKGIRLTSQEFANSCG